MYTEIHEWQEFNQKVLYFKLNNTFNLQVDSELNHKFSGIYAIFKDDICLYVGQSSNLASRIATHLKGKYKFLVITEGWCGDAAQIVPVIQKIVLSAPNKFNLKLVLRDQNLELIDAHLTNGGRAIPVLLILDEQGNLIMPKWGPRPQILQDLMMSWKQESTDMEVLAEKLHSWYAKDKTQAIQLELTEVLSQLD